MKKYELIKEYKDDIDNVCSYLIDEAIDMSRKLNNNNLVLGVDCSINREYNGLEEAEHNSKAMWAGFIREDVKIVYKFVKDEANFTVNDGCYYYMDDYKYIYDFSKYIANKNINNDYEFLDLVLEFLDKYLYKEFAKEESDIYMYPLVYDTNGRAISDSGKHSIEDFYNANKAQCSEYSAMASNILSTFGYNVLYLGGSVNSTAGSGGHAFNIAILDDGYAIIDFSLPVINCNIEGKVTKASPFIGMLEEDSMNYISICAINHDEIELTDYEIVHFGNSKLYMSTNNNRYYVIGNVNYYDDKKYTK